MKVTVSISDDLFEELERIARRTKTSRTRLFSDALKEYFMRHSPDKVSEAVNKASSAVGAGKDTFVSSAARRVLERTAW